MLKSIDVSQLKTIIVIVRALSILNKGSDFLLE